MNAEDYWLGVCQDPTDAHEELQKAILNNTKRYQQLIADAVDQALPPPTTDVVEDIFDVLERQVRAAQETCV